MILLPMPPVVILFAMRTVIGPWAAKTFGWEIGKNPFFGFGFFALAIMLYLMLIVLATRIWEKLGGSHLRRMYFRLVKQDVDQNQGQQ